MLPDLGYTWTQMRHWATSSLGHNLVVVNRKDQATSGSDGNLLMYIPNADGISVVEADGKRSYSNIDNLDMYRRTLMMIPVSDENAYVVDIFRLRGGNVHDWTINGDADQDTSAVCSLNLNSRRKWMLEDSEVWKEPILSGDVFNPYGMIREVLYGNSTIPFEVTFQYLTDTTKGIRVHITDKEGAEVWLGRSPSVRKAKMDTQRAWDYWMPKLIVRKKGEAPLQSIFAAVEEPFQGKPFISKVERVDLGPQNENVVAIHVTHGETVDTIISTLDEPPYKELYIADRGIRMQGKLGIVRQVSGKTERMWLFNGNMLQIGGKGITENLGQYSGVLLDTFRREDGKSYNAFVTDVALPQGRALHGNWMIVQLANGYTQGHEIDYVDKRNNKTVIVITMDHGLRIAGNKTQEIFFPQRQFEGLNRFMIHLSASSQNKNKVQ